VIRFDADPSPDAEQENDLARPLRVVILGLGPIGRAVAKEVVRSRDLTIAGAVDPAPAIAGSDLGDLLEEPSLSGKQVAASLDHLNGARTDVAAHLAASRFSQALPHLRDLLRRKLPVVSTCEELIAARYRWPKQIRELDGACREAGIPIVVAGINPGFIMDVLPAALANVSVAVRSVKIERHVDTSTRRFALQEKTGAGIGAAEFRRRVRERSIGHVGLRDSLLFLMNHLPLDGDVGDEKIRPILAEHAFRRGGRQFEKGAVLGVHQTCRAREKTTGQVVASFDLKMAFGLADPHDEIRIEGDPPIRLRCEGGIAGDRATVGAVLSAIRSVPEVPPGFQV
jgi:4-hydroxy-tetrahydrodipicolinate reductase